ncbi:MAG: FadR/GntR family transcriptional regulator [Pseudomonadota bacterium]
MPFRHIESQRLYQRVAEQIVAIIRKGELAVGDRLPPERDLSVKLGVSRPTVREAMIALELAGFVDVRTGAGTYVVSSGPTNYSVVRALADAGPGPLELIEARLMIEPQVAACASRSIAPVQVKRLRALVDAMAVAATSDERRQCDRDFHVLIAQATGNGVIAATVDELWSNMFTPIFERLGQMTGLVSKIEAETHEQHEAVLAAIADGDPRSAEAAMRAHLENVKKVLSGAAHQSEPLRSPEAIA